LNDILYINLLEDEKNLKVKPNREYMNRQGDINLLIGKKYWRVFLLFFIKKKRKIVKNLKLQQ